MFKDFVNVPIPCLKEERDIHYSDEQKNWWGEVGGDGGDGGYKAALDLFLDLS